MSSIDTLEKVRKQIRDYIPKNIKLSKVEFEGPEIAVYTQDSKALVDDNNILRVLAKKMRKRIVIRSDPEVRLPREETIEFIQNLVASDAEITKIFFDDNLGEITIEAKKPGLVIGKMGVNLKQIRIKTLWRPKVVRTPPIESKTVYTVRNLLKNESKNQKEILLRIGRRIHRPQIFKDIHIRLTPLGGFREVGRSSVLLQTLDSNILLDCGMNVGNPRDLFPRLNSPEFDIENLDAVIVSHAHMDHSGLVPFLYKYGYDGPVYCTAPTRNLMTMLQLDYIGLSNREGRHAPYGKTDVKQEILHTIPLSWGKVTDIGPDVKLTLHNAGHILGSSITHLHFGNGDHNLVYSGDYKFQRTRLLEPAMSKFPRLETLITESTYGGVQDVIPSRHESERNLANIVKATVKAGGKLLIPVLAVGRAQEILIILEEFINKKIIPQVPIFLEGMISEATAIHTTHPEYLNADLRQKIFHQGKNPFLSEVFHTVEGGSNEREEIVQGDPCIIMATSGMLQGGPSIQYLKMLANDERNRLLFVSYQVEGTLGRRIQKGYNDIQFESRNGKSSLTRLKMKVHTISGFSGHSSRSQIISFIRKVRPRPERVITNHGESSKCKGLASLVHKRLKSDTRSLVNTETIVLK
ncbi:MAG: beta-CASP ribonuclease aCPSF1 [Candidatus Lokiarchaeota archaeon]|nr:beta-CASP ribonuclease aCPSF1 [Candidatus Lokiarchaeota archaeon]